MSLVTDIQNAYKNASVVEKLIYINILVFFIVFLSQKSIIFWFGLPSNTTSLLSKPWTLISYAFLHGDLFHILSTSIVLFYIGNLFLAFYTAKQFKTVYFFGILAGAAFFFLGSKGGYLIGASAAVTAIIIAIATKAPHYALQLRFIGSVELWVLAVIWVGLSILQVSAVNGGGQLSHIGGAFIGYLYAILLQKGINIGSGFEQLIEIFAGFFRNEKNKSHLKTVYKSKNVVSKKTSDTKQQKINRILDKISTSGYESLSKEDKEFLFKAGKQ